MIKITANIGSRHKRIFLSLLTVLALLISSCAESPESFKKRIQSATLETLFSAIRCKSMVGKDVLLFHGSLTTQSVLRIEVTDYPLYPMGGRDRPRQVGRFKVNLTEMTEDPRAIKRDGEWAVVIRPVRVVRVAYALTERHPELVTDDGIALPFHKWISDWRNEFAAREFVKRLLQTRHMAVGKTERPQIKQNDYAHFSKWGLTFDYPKGWQESPANQVARMKKYLNRELQPQGRRLQEFTMIVGDNDGIALLVSKGSIPKNMKPSELIEERKQVYNDAKQAGDVTKINFVKETTIATLPAVVEDVERSNGGRGRTYKILDGTTVFEISLIVNNASRFSRYSAFLNHLVLSMKVSRKGSN